MANRDPRIAGTPFENSGRAYVAEVKILQFQDGVAAEHHLVAPTGCAFAVDRVKEGVFRVAMYGPLGEADHLGSVEWNSVVQVVDGLLAATFPNMPQL